MVSHLAMYTSVSYPIEVRMENFGWHRTRSISTHASPRCAACWVSPPAGRLLVADDAMTATLVRCSAERCCLCNKSMPTYTVHNNTGQAH